MNLYLLIIADEFDPSIVYFNNELALVKLDVDFTASTENQRKCWDHGAFSYKDVRSLHIFMENQIRRIKIARGMQDRRRVNLNLDIKTNGYKGR